MKCKAKPEALVCAVSKGEKLLLGLQMFLMYDRCVCSVRNEVSPSENTKHISNTEFEFALDSPNVVQQRGNVFSVTLFI